MATQWHIEMTLAINAEYTRMRNAGAPKNFGLFIYADVSAYGDEGLTIKYTLGGGYSDPDKTEGADLHNVVTEYLRRKNWTENNKPMVLIGNGSVIDNDPQPDANSEAVVKSI